MKTTRPNLESLLYSAVLIAGLMLPDATQAQSPKSAYSAGQKAPAFVAKTVDGKTVRFPEDYKGKIVLLDFWAMWCGPCRAEMPNVTAAYEKYHGKGFEVLGVSLDRAQESTKLKSFVNDNKMPWPQIYDGKYWQADVAVKYGIKSIPRPILIDGSTGVILAEGPDARGPRLGAAIEKALAAKTGK